MKALLPLLAVLLIVRPSLAGCGQFFSHHRVHHAQAVVLAQPLYFAGQSTHDEAQLRKAIRAEAPAIIAGVLQQLQASPQAVQSAPAPGSVLSAKCVSCHSGDNAKGGFRLDGTLDCETKVRALEVLAGIDVPPGMKPVLGKLQQSDYPALMQELLSKPAANEPGRLE